MRICFIGGGNMATALIGGLLQHKLEANQLRVVEINADSCARLSNEFGVQAGADLGKGVVDSDVIIIAVKPQQLHQVSTTLAPLLTGQLLISIAAGVRAADLARWLATKNVVRAMPNTPALIRSGITGLYAFSGVNKVRREQAQSILEVVGKVLWVRDEGMLDAVTAISGSGPGYVFYFMESLQQAARELGFNEADARRLVLGTFLGAAMQADASGEDVSVLRARVTSKNGTTERALLSMELNEVKKHIIGAALLAADRSREMGNELGKD